MDLMDKHVGSEAEVKISFSAGKMHVAVSYAGKQATAGVTVDVGADLLLDAAAADTNSVLLKEALALLGGAIKAIP